MHLCSVCFVLLGSDSVIAFLLSSKLISDIRISLWTDYCIVLHPILALIAVER